MTARDAVVESVALKDWALMYAGLGWKVLPVWNAVGQPGARQCACPKGAECDRPAKHPIADLVPNGVNDATGERTKIENWWDRMPEASIGIATGSISGLTVVDADAGGGKPGLINLTRLGGQNGGLPETLRVETGGGGLHVYLNYDERLRTGTDVLDEAIDVRSDGGFVIAPPSLHVRGDYRFAAGCSVGTALKDVPEWMLTAPAEALQRSAARRRGRPRTREAMPLDKVESMLAVIDPDDRDKWLKIGLLVGRMYVGTPAEPEAWSLYETWSARSPKFDQDRAGCITRMREQFYELSQQEPRQGAERLGVGTLFLWAREGGWTPFGDRAVVRYEPSAESRMCDELVKALVDGGERNRFFAIQGEVREVIHAPLTSVRMVYRAIAAGEPPPEGLILRTASTPALQSALSECAVLAVTNARGEPAAKAIPQELATMVLKSHFGGFPALTGIATWPMVMEGQVLHRARGYDAATGMYFDIDDSVRLDLDTTPEAGWAWLRDEMLKDFPFEDDLHRAGALALLLAMMLRLLMKTCPAFAVVAPQPGTGKSTLIEAAAVAVHGAPIAVHAFSAEGEELRKALHAMLGAKIPAVMFDNLPRGGAVSSDHLAKLITAESSSDRVLGRTEMRTEANTMLIAFTGNNIAFVRDLASRVAVLRLNARTADPIGRSFAHPDLRAWALANRSRVLSALVAVARLADGSLAPGKASRFEDFEVMVVGPVHRVTGEDVRLLLVPDAADTEDRDETREALAAIYVWQQEGRSGAERAKWTAQELASAVDATASPRGPLEVSKASAIRRWAGDERRWASNPGRLLGYALRAARDDHAYEPYVLRAERIADRGLWLVENLSASTEAGSAPGSEGPF